MAGLAGHHTTLPPPPKPQSGVKEFPTGEIAARLDRNSREREEAEKLLADQHQRLTRLLAKMGTTVNRLTELTQARVTLELEANSMMGLAPSTSTSLTNIMSATAPPNSVTTGLPAESLSVLMDFGRPSGSLIRLPSGEFVSPTWSTSLFSHAQPMMAASATSMPTLGGHIPRDDRLDSSDEEEDEGPLEYAFMEQDFIEEIPGCKPGIPVYGGDRKLLGLIGQDSSFRRAKRVPMEWRLKLENEVPSKKLVGITEVEGGTKRMLEVVANALKRREEL